MTRITLVETWRIDGHGRPAAELLEELDFRLGSDRRRRGNYREHRIADEHWIEAEYEVERTRVEPSRDPVREAVEGGTVATGTREPPPPQEVEGLSPA